MKNLILILMIGLVVGCESSVKKSEDNFDQEFGEKYKDELDELEKMEKSGNWKKIKPKGGELQCPCCDYFTLEERGGYEICPICFWEDDGIDLVEVDEYSGPNHMTLREGRLNYEKYGACDSLMIKNVISESQRMNFRFEKRIIK